MDYCRRCKRRNVQWRKLRQTVSRSEWSCKQTASRESGRTARRLCGNSLSPETWSCNADGFGHWRCSVAAPNARPRRAGLIHPRHFSTTYAVVYDWLKTGQFGELRHPSCSRALIRPEAPRKLLVEAQAPRLANQIQGMQKRRSVALSDDARLVPWLRPILAPRCNVQLGHFSDNGG